MRRLCSTSLLLILTSAGFAQTDLLREKLIAIARSANAEVGIAFKDLITGDSITLKGNDQFPMQSVFKLPLSLYILSQADQGKLKMDQKIKFTPDDYYKTWSPIMKQYPEGNVALTLEDVLMYTLKHSDNVGCDVLFRLAGGPEVVEKYIHSLGIKDIAVRFTEEDMHSDWNVQFKNWCTPWAMLQLLERIDQGNFLSPSSHEFVWKNLVETPLGPQRIKSLLPQDVVVAHRTGTGNRNDQNIMGAVNDVGILQLPNGKKFALVVYVSKSPEEHNKLETLIAEVAKAVYDHGVKQ